MHASSYYKTNGILLLLNIPIIHIRYSTPEIFKSANLFKEDEAGRTCDTHGGGEKCVKGFGWEARK
jgi:hypothetical protein